MGSGGSSTRRGGVEGGRRVVSLPPNVRVKGNGSLENIADEWVRSSAPPLVDEELADDMPLETLSDRDRHVAGIATPVPPLDAKMRQRGPSRNRKVPLALGDPSPPSYVDDCYYSPAEAKLLEVVLPPPTDDAVSMLEIRWQRGEQIGKGAFGQVFMGINMETNGFVAVKQVPFSVNDSESRKDIEVFKQEVSILKLLDHPNIVKYIGMTVQDGDLNIFLEYIPSGSIADLIQKLGTLRETTIRTYCEQILRGLQYLHNRVIVHRDIKCANVLVDPTGKIKLTDFGASRRLRRISLSARGPQAMCGTPHFMAPEAIEFPDKLCRQSDIWSLGISMIEMATGKPPLSELPASQVLLMIVKSDKMPAIPECFGREANEFISLCLRRKHKERPNATRLLTHPFIKVIEASPDSLKVAEKTSREPLLDPLSPGLSPLSPGLSPLSPGLSSKRSPSSPSRIDRGKKSSRTLIRVQPSPKTEQLPAPVHLLPTLDEDSAEAAAIEKCLNEFQEAAAKALAT